MLRAAAAVSVGVFLAHALSPVLTSGDSRWTVPVALSLIERGDADLNEYLELIQRNDYYAVECVQAGGTVGGAAMGECVGGSLRNHYPIGVPLMATPGVWLLSRMLVLAGPLIAHLPVFGFHPILDGLLRADLIEGRVLAEMIIASSFIAAAAALMLLTAARFLPLGWAAGVALVFAFATPAWSTGSRSLYQHGPTMLLISLVLWLLAGPQRRPLHYALAGLASAWAYLVRPTNSLLVVVVGLYILHYRRRAFPAFALAALPLLTGFLAYNWVTYGNPLPPYYRQLPPPLDSWRAVMAAVHALAANLVSPSRGLFIFTPVFLFSLAGAWQAIRSRWLAPLPAWLAVMAGLQILVVARFYRFWAGGHAYGPRLTSELTPLLVFF